MPREQYVLAEGVSYQGFGTEEDGVMLSLQSGYIYRCNFTALPLLDRLRDGATVDDLRALLESEYELPESQACEDAETFVRQLLDEKLARRLAA